IYTVKNTFEENPNIEYTDGRHVVFFNASAYKHAKTEKIKTFLEYLSTKNSKDELTDKIDNIVSTTKVKEEFGRTYMIAKMRDVMMRKEGYVEGFSSGIQQGKHEQALETAKNMLKKEIIAETVAECTGLSLDTIENLKEALFQTG
ncbi:MAG: Rpn family recombination-promoting nuclease/putative transposase, partial [Spirochaetaceae bacterium]|nr:Rpn family recombination-promoting nuclease/putative transposase [Spirochaetaceae bacterium]